LPMVRDTMKIAGGSERDSLVFSYSDFPNDIASSRLDFGTRRIGAASATQAARSPFPSRI